MAAEKPHRSLSKLGIVSCLMAVVSTILWVLALLYQHEGDLGAAISFSILLVAILSASAVGAIFAVAGLVIARGHRTLPILGLVANFIIAAGVLVYDWWPDTNELVSAASRGDVAKVQRCIAFGVDVNEPTLTGWEGDREGDTPLTAAAQRGTVDAVIVLLDHGADVNKPNGGGWSALHWAALLGRADIVQALLDGGANVDVLKRDKRTPLHSAASQGQLRIVQLLVNHGADMSKKDGKGKTARELADLEGHTETAEWLRSQTSDE